MSKSFEHAFATHAEMIEVMRVGKVYLRDLVREIQDVYTADDRPWICLLYTSDAADE